MAGDPGPGADLRAEERMEQSDIRSVVDRLDRLLAAIELAPSSEQMSALTHVADVRPVLQRLERISAGPLRAIGGRLDRIEKRLDQLEQRAPGPSREDKPAPDQARRELLSQIDLITDRLELLRRRILPPG